MEGGVALVGMLAAITIVGGREGQLFAQRAGGVIQGEIRLAPLLARASVLNRGHTSRSHLLQELDCRTSRDEQQDGYFRPVLICSASSVAPLLDSSLSSAATTPRSPWSASVGLRNRAISPIEEN